MKTTSKLYTTWYNMCSSKSACQNLQIFQTDHNEWIPFSSWVPPGSWAPGRGHGTGNKFAPQIHLFAGQEALQRGIHRHTEDVQKPERCRSRSSTGGWWLVPKFVVKKRHRKSPMEKKPHEFGLVEDWLSQRRVDLQFLHLWQPEFCSKTVRHGPNRLHPTLNSFPRNSFATT